MAKVPDNRLNVRLELDISVRNIVDGCSREEALELIKQIDATQQDWGFTLALCDHFDALRAVHTKETMEERGEK